MSFDYMGAKNEGYTDDQIMDHLKKSYPKFDYDGAIKEGYGISEIADHVSTEERPSYGTLFKEGLKRSTPAMIAEIDGVDLEKQDIDPEGIIENVIYSGAEYLPDIATLPLGVGVADRLGSTAMKQLAKQGVKTAAKKQGKKFIEKELAKMGVEGIARKGGLRAAVESISKVALKKAEKASTKDIIKSLPKLVGGKAIEGASIGGVAEAFHSPLKQYIEKGKVDPVKTAGDIASMAAMGAGGEVALMPVAAGLKGAFKGLTKPFKIDKGINPAKLSRIVAEATEETDILQQTIQSGKGKIKPELQEIVDIVKSELPVINVKGTLGAEERNILSAASGDRLKNYLVRQKLRAKGYALTQQLTQARN